MTVLAALDTPSITGALALLNLALAAGTVFWVLTIKREPTSAIAWCLLVIFVPVLGSLLFVLLGYQSIHAPLRRKRRHASEYRGRPPTPDGPNADGGYEGLAGWPGRLGAAPLTGGNAVDLYHDGGPAYEAMLEAIAAAKHHIHMEFFITRGDDSGRRFIDRPGRAGPGRRGGAVPVRRGRLLQVCGRGCCNILTDAGGKALPFLPMMQPDPAADPGESAEPPQGRGRGRPGRVHRRAEHRRRVPGPATRSSAPGGTRSCGWRARPSGACSGCSLEDWDFAAGEDLSADVYFPDNLAARDATCRWRGPARTRTTRRSARCTSRPSCGRDSGSGWRPRTSSRTRAIRRPVPGRPDGPWTCGSSARSARTSGCRTWPARYLLVELLRAGGKVYQYTAGLMHAKVLIVDDEWASVGSPNFDNRSLHLNFEVNLPDRVEGGVEGPGGGVPARLRRFDPAGRRDVRAAAIRGEDVRERLPAAVAGSLRECSPQRAQKAQRGKAERD